MRMSSVGTVADICAAAFGNSPEACGVTGFDAPARVAKLDQPPSGTLPAVLRDLYAEASCVAFETLTGLIGVPAWRDRIRFRRAMTDAADQLPDDLASAHAMILAERAAPMRR
ncbi:hypothetical protein X761_30890 [Mesorhizobium sp. LSHC424B00]|nr:hypothetical protein X761_30890 [Mesorhizobium sp. LSHC424B00]